MRDLAEALKRIHDGSEIEIPEGDGLAGFTPDEPVAFRDFDLASVVNALQRLRQITHVKPLAATRGISYDGPPLSWRCRRYLGRAWSLVSLQLPLSRWVSLRSSKICGVKKALPDSRQTIRVE